MSFSSDLKCELTEEEIQAPEARHAMAYGMLLFGKSFSNQQIALSTENEQVAKLYAQCIADISGLPTQMSLSPQKRKDGIFTATLQNKKDCEELRGLFYHRSDEISLRIKKENFSGEGDIAHFLRGAYLACGNLTDPLKSYHLEFVTQHLKLAEDLYELISEVLAPPKMTTRRGSRVIYYKESEHIEDMLTYMGAVRSSLELMNVKIYKDVRNKVNRVTNCETANIEKTVAASAAQVEDILYLWEKKGKNSLPEELQELAQLRVDNPEMSLRELGEALGEPITRSGVNHRLKRLSRMAQQLRGED